MPIVIFDVDGTLTETTAVDTECYTAAVRAELGVEVPDDWSAYDEVTDAAILARACALAGYAPPDRQATDRVAARVASMLRRACEAEPHRFRPVAGARTIFGALTAAGWCVSIATGAWRPSALVKLRGARIPHRGVPLASATDHAERVEIVRRAARAHPAAGGPVVYVGDGVWDARAAARAGYAFVGVASGAKAAALREAGATVVVPDLRDPRAIIDLPGRERRS